MSHLPRYLAEQERLDRQHSALAECSRLAKLQLSWLADIKLDVPEVVTAAATLRELLGLSGANVARMTREIQAHMTRRTG